MNPALRARALDALTTHRHGDKREPCRYCTSYYSELLDRLEPFISEEADDEFRRGRLEGFERGWWLAHQPPAPTERRPEHDGGEGEQ